MQPRWCLSFNLNGKNSSGSGKTAHGRRWELDAPQWSEFSCHLSRASILFLSLLVRYLRERNNRDHLRRAIEASTYGTFHQWADRSEAKSRARSITRLNFKQLGEKGRDLHLDSLVTVKTKLIRI